MKESRMNIGVDTYTATIHMAGDIETAKRWLRSYCYQRGLCVTVTPTTFIYTGGEESGFSIGLVNYPRFPSSSVEVYGRATEIAELLIVECCQKTALVVSADNTKWIQIDPPGARQ